MGCQWIENDFFNYSAESAAWNRNKVCVLFSGRTSTPRREPRRSQRHLIECYISHNWRSVILSDLLDSQHSGDSQRDSHEAYHQTDAREPLLLTSFACWPYGRRSDIN